MSRTVSMFAAATALVASTLFSSQAHADGANTNHALAILRPAEGRVGVTVRVSESRAVWLPENVIADAEGRASSSTQLRFVCHTPCRLYLRPGAVRVALVGWATNHYEWNIPSRGGAINLLARRPDGSLMPMPVASDVRRTEVATNERRAATGRTVAMNDR